jgi:hypothetical protein
MSAVTCILVAVGHAYVVFSSHFASAFLRVSLLLRIYLYYHCHHQVVPRTTFLFYKYMELLIYKTRTTTMPRSSSSPAALSSRYTPLPQLDLEMQTSSGSPIQSITLSNRVKEDGSVVKRKETLLFDGTVLVDETLISLPTCTIDDDTTSKHANTSPFHVQWIPTTIHANLLPVTIHPLTDQLKKKHRQRRDFYCRLFMLFIVAIALILSILKLLSTMTRDANFRHKFSLDHSKN